MASVRYCIINSSNGYCTDVILWDDTYTYSPPSGSVIAGDNTGEIGWTYDNGASSGGAWSPPMGSSGSTDLEPVSVFFGGTGADNAATARTNLGVATGLISYVIDGGGSVITTGLKGFLQIPFACTINSWTIMADATGSMVIDIWKDTYANYPPTVADTITASAKPSLSSANKATSSTLTGWTTSIAADDVLAFNVDSASTVQRVTITLKVTRA